VFAVSLLSNLIGASLDMPQLVASAMLVQKRSLVPQPQLHDWAILDCLVNAACLMQASLYNSHIFASLAFTKQRYTYQHVLQGHACCSFDATHTI